MPCPYTHARGQTIPSPTADATPRAPTRPPGPCHRRRGTACRAPTRTPGARRSRRPRPTRRRVPRRDPRVHVPDVGARHAVPLHTRPGPDDPVAHADAIPGVPTRPGVHVTD